MGAENQLDFMMRPTSKSFDVRFGPLFVKFSNSYLAAWFVLPYVVDSVAAT